MAVRGREEQRYESIMGKKKKRNEVKEKVLCGS